MKFQYSLILLFCFSFALSFSQDLIIKKNGDQINAKIGEVNKKQVTYSFADDPDLKVYTIAGDLIKLIRYANGKEINFEVSNYARGFISLSFGRAAPMGAFASTNYSSASSGHADNGGLVNLNVGVYVFRNIGLCFDIGAMANSVNDDDSLNRVVDYEGPYWASNFLAGPMYSLKFGKKIILDSKVQGGVVFVSLPAMYSQTNSTYSSTGYSSYDINTTAKASFGFSGGLALRFMPSTRIGLNLNAQILTAYAKQTFEEETYTYNYDTSSSTSDFHSGSFYMPFTTLNLSFGLVYHFKRKNN